jgi:Malectin domain/IPT/TIG domain
VFVASVGTSFTYPRYSFLIAFSYILISFTTVGSRIFDIQVEDSVILDIDIVDRANGLANAAVTIDIPVPVADGFLTITAMENVPRFDNAKLSAIEVQLIGPHSAHAVTGGPYTVVDADGDGFAVVSVDATESHTHAIDQKLNSFVWKEGNTIIGSGNVTSFTLPVGQHVVTLTVGDTSNDRNTDTTTISVLPKSFPSVTSIDPVSGNVAGGTLVTITGTGLEFATAVRFGVTMLTGSAITVVNPNTITVVSPFSGSEVPAPVSVITPTAESNSKNFNYISAIPIRFNLFQLLAIQNPTAVAFGPDSKLYVGTLKGQLGKYTLNESFDTVLNSVVVTINATRGIHGIAFNPLDHANTLNPTIYISTSDIFHNEARNSVGDAVNGKIQTVRGANLDVVTDIVRGLPVSALDHSVCDGLLCLCSLSNLWHSLMVYFSWLGERHLLWKQRRTVHCYWW